MNLEMSDKDRITELETELQRMQEKNQQQSEELKEMHSKLYQAYMEIERMRHSFSWRIMTPFRFCKNKFITLMEKTVITHKIRKAVHILFHNGWSEFRSTFRRFLFVMRQKQEGIEEGIIATHYNKPLTGYDAEYQENIDYSEHSTDIKPLAFYLPQYHTFPENDAWWGKGFTEWVNVKSGTPGFDGHYQPREPHPDFGYYCLEDINVIKKQARLAKQHGIYGFVFYYYWFSGKRLMERPVDMLLKHPEIDLPFCLCWANENWTRAWDGKNKDILIGQKYSDEDDERFIADLKPYIDDPRYIRINQKPLIIVYNPGQIPDCHKSFVTWRRKSKELGLGEILIWTCETANNTASALKIEDCIDAIIEFPPHNMWMDSIAVRGVDLHGKSAFLYHYSKLAEDRISRMKDEKPGLVPVHHGIMLGWDNAARRKDGWFTYCGFSLKALYRWTLAVADRTRKDFLEEERYCFINAWNEWGEGTYLEPDLKYGYSSINTVSKALYSLPLQDDLKIFNRIPDEPIPQVSKEIREKASIAVHVHMFYLETLEETIENLNYIPYPFDCYVSTDTEGKQKVIEEIMNDTCKAQHVFVQVYQNRGRDVGPFLVQMHEVYNQYKYICHIHSKKSKWNDHGNEWRKYNFRHLFGSEENIRQIIHQFETDPKLGIVMPETYPVLEQQAEWGGNKEGVKDLLNRMGIKTDLPNDPIFPVGNMFWARSDAVKPIFQLNLKQSDFPEEEGQVNTTIAHCIERSWISIILSASYTYLKTFNNCTPVPQIKKIKRLAIFAHYQSASSISNDDLETIRSLSAIMSSVHVMSNSPLSEKDISKIEQIAGNITVRQRENIGLDFGAWRDTLLTLGRANIQGYDEVILCNNSFFPPVFPLQEMLATMEDKHLDFWGNTIFPRLDDGSYIHKDYIPEHLQSYWMAFGTKPLQSDVFWQFWELMPDYKDYIDVVANCESQLTELLSRESFTYEPYIRETYYISRFLNNFALPYEKPSSLLLLGDTFIKKKCYEYMSPEEKAKLEYLWKQLKQNDTNGNIASTEELADEGNCQQ